MLRRLSLIALAAALLLLPPAVLAQEQQPDYAIRNIRTAAPSSADELVVQFEVLNLGGPAAQATTAVLALLPNLTQIAEQPVAALGANASATVTMRIPISALPADQSAVSLRAAVGVGDIEPPNGPNISNNYAQIRLPIPRLITPQVVPTAPGGGGTGAAGSGQPSLTRIGSFELPFGLDLYNRQHVALLVGIAAITLVVLWVISVVLRLIFSKPPQFPAWQPPYAIPMMPNPATLAGVRQLWQQHAQSDALPLPCAYGDYAARKVLAGVGGAKLAGWRVTHLRISQYDMYGRVARTQTVANPRIVKRLDAAVRKSAHLTPKDAERAARPIAKMLLKSFRKPLKRTPTLPIALDIRFSGQHGSVRIIFELYTCTGAQWQLVDQWEPDLMVYAGALQENFTYTLFGQQAGEPKREFRKRLERDLTLVLASMVQQPPPSAVPVDTHAQIDPLAPPPPPTAQIPVVAAEIPSQPTQFGFDTENDLERVLDAVEGSAPTSPVIPIQRQPEPSSTTDSSREKSDE